MGRGVRVTPKAPRLSSLVATKTLGAVASIRRWRLRAPAFNVLVLAAALVGGGLAVAASPSPAAATHHGCTNSLSDDCFGKKYYGSAYHRGWIGYSSPPYDGGWTAQIQLRDKAGDRYCTYSQWRQKVDGAWSGWRDGFRVCEGKTLTDNYWGTGFKAASWIQFRIRAPGVGISTAVTCNRGTDGSDACR